LNHLWNKRSQSRVGKRKLYGVKAMKMLAAALGAMTAITLLSGCAYDNSYAYGYSGDRYAYGYGYNGSRYAYGYNGGRYYYGDRYSGGYYGRGCWYDRYGFRYCG
jgi:hypothetical protein